MYEVVLGVPVGDTTAGVVRKPDGHLVFGGTVYAGGGVVLSDLRPHGSHVEGRLVVVGRLPERVSAVTVIDDAGDEHAATVGEGVWVAVGGEAGFSEPLVRYADASGALVAPLPDGPRRPVADAREACPVCGAAAWIEVDAEHFGEVRTEVRCGRCGVEVGAGMTFIRLGAAPAEVRDDEPRPGYRDWQAEWERSQAAELARVSIPVYAVAALSPTIGSWGEGDDDDITSVGVDHQVGPGALQVATELCDDVEPRPGELRGRLTGLLERREPSDDVSDSALKIHMTATRRAARRRAEGAPSEQRRFVIDGESEAFEFMGIEGAWVARREHYGLEITIVARDIDPGAVVLERLMDPANVGAGTTAQPAPLVHARRRAAAGALLSREQVAALIDECGLGEHREAVLGAVLPAYRLEPAESGSSRIGGLPDLADGEAWPHGEDGIPYTFVAQFDCSALPPLESEFGATDWRHGGALVRIFAALDARVPEPGPAVALACPPDTPVTRASLPPRPDRMPDDAFEPDDESLRQLHETCVRPVPFLTAAIGWYVLPEHADDLDEEYRTFADRLAGGGAPSPESLWRISQLLGHAETAQGEDPRYAGELLFGDDPALEPLNAWRVLLNIADSYEGMSFGDGGALAIVAPAADLARGRYDRLVTEPSMG